MTSGLVTLVTVPGVEDVMVTTIVHPPAGIDAPAGRVTRFAVTATPVHVPLLPEVVVTPAGIASVNAEVRMIAPALPLPSARHQRDSDAVA